MNTSYSSPVIDQLMSCLALLPSGTASLVSLSDLNTITTRAALTGTSSLSDAAVICPGLHKQQDSAELSKGEYPACAAMTTGYAFRVENEATVFQLQRLGRPGHLTTVRVSDGKQKHSSIVRSSNADGSVQLMAVAMTLTAGAMLAYLEDYRAITALVVILLVRAVNVAIFRRRTKMGWKGTLEPDVEGDLIVLLSQDRWIRIRGLVDDIKAVTSGQWLREMTFSESSLVSSSKLLLCVNAALMWEASKQGQLILLALLLATTALIGLANKHMTEFKMYGRSMSPEGRPKAYNRRLDMAKDLIEETGRCDWAIRLGMIQPKSSDLKRESDLGPKIM